MRANATKVNTNRPNYSIFFIALDIGYFPLANLCLYKFEIAFRKLDGCF